MKELIEFVFDTPRSGETVHGSFPELHASDLEVGKILDIHDREADDLEGKYRIDKIDPPYIEAERKRTKIYISKAD